MMLLSFYVNKILDLMCHVLVVVIRFWRLFLDFVFQFVNRKGKNFNLFLLN
jgi:hypothetical protein